VRFGERSDPGAKLGELIQRQVALQRFPDERALAATASACGAIQPALHVLVDPERRGEMDSLLGRIRTIANEEFNIRHVTVQLETTAANWKEDPRVAARLGRRG